MKKEFNTAEELMADAIFMKHLKVKWNDLVRQRSNRPEPKKGYKYIRDGYDQLVSENQDNLNYVIKEVPLLLEKKSKLSRSKREIINIIIGQAYNATILEYKNMPEPEDKPKRVKGTTRNNRKKQQDETQVS